MFVFGIAFLTIGRAVLLLAAGLGLLVWLVRTCRESTAGLYRRLVRKEGAK
jgi:hypothetical protein